MFKKKIYDAGFLLDFDLDPPAEKWNLVSSDEDALKETYKSADYVISLEEQRKPNYIVVGFNIKREDGRSFTVKQYVLSVDTYMHDLHRIWIPYHTLYMEFMWLLRSIPWGPPSFALADSRSCTHFRMPIMLGLNRKGIVTLGAGFLDQRIETMMMARGSTHSPLAWGGLDKGMFNFQLKRPLNHTLGPTSELKDAFFATKGPLWFDTMHDYRKAYDEKMNRQVKPSPDPCWEPICAPWFARPGKWGKDPVEDVDEELLLESMKIGVDLGIRNIMGMGSWFFSSKYHRWTGPDECGDYLPDTSKFPDFRGFVRRLHHMNARIMLWIDPFAVGRYSKMREKMKDMLIPGTSYLCPRNPSVQKHVAELVARVLRDYEADGYTMDLMDYVPLETCTASHTHNFSSVGIALDHCYAQMKTAIDSVKSDAIIEFRQPYANINNLNYASAFRAVDSGEAGDFELNRRNCVLLRSYVPPGVAVHTDPMWWRLDEDEKTVAKMLSTIVVSGVPSIGADLINIPESHHNLIKSWLTFYNQHKQDFRYGQMKPIQNDPQFSTIMITSPGKAFVSYGNYPALKIPLAKDASEIHLFNCTLEDSLYTILQGIKGEYKAELYDHTFTSIGETKVKSKKGEALLDLNIPQGGYSLLRKM